MKEVLSEFLSYLKYKVDNDLLTIGELESLFRAMAGSLQLVGTVDEMARFYGKPRTNVSSLINRRMFKKPVRRVFYSFNELRKIVPESWKCQDESH